MARTLSNMLALGTIAPDFTLPNVVNGKQASLTALKGERGTLVMFICNHCPYVLHVNSVLIDLATYYQPKGISFIAISANDAKAYPEDGPVAMKLRAEELNYPFPYLYDESQEVAKAYVAACTPDFFLFDENLALVYRGQLDNSRPGNGIPATGTDLAHAIDCLLNNNENVEVQKPSMGCNIKWKEGG
ncbi:thioredoxin family protein [Flavobacteriaceae bacterium F08102]|nr:thioredoxin family protein [Flavobacteriaceae bacterium F08102]